jgi:hypothetical protein
MARPQGTNSSNAKDATVKQSGDNRRLGDDDGNAASGNSKSPGVDNPADEAPEQAPAARNSNKG